MERPVARKTSKQVQYIWSYSIILPPHPSIGVSDTEDNIGYEDNVSVSTFVHYDDKYFGF